MCIREKHLFHNYISTHFKFLLSNERLDFCEFFNNADSFSVSSLIIFTKGADIFGHDCILCTIFTNVRHEM